MIPAEIFHQLVDESGSYGRTPVLHDEYKFVEGVWTEKDIEATIATELEEELRGKETQS